MIEPLLNFINHEEASLSPLLPVASTLNKVFQCLDYVYHMFWLKQEASLVLNSKTNFLKAIAGSIIHVKYGDNPIIQAAARITLVARRLLEFSNQKRNHFDPSYREWRDLFQKKFPLRPYTFLPSLSDISPFHGILPLKKQFVIKHFAAKWQIHVDSIAKRTFCFLKEFFKLLLCYKNLYSACSLCQSKDESLNLSVFNTIEVINELLENKEVFIKEMEDNEEYIEKILMAFKSPFTAKDLKEAVIKALECGDRNYERLHSVYHTTLDTLRQGTFILIDTAIDYPSSRLLSRSPSQSDKT